MLHKIINNLVDIDTNQDLEPAVVRGEEAVRFIIPYARTSAYKYNFLIPSSCQTVVQHTGSYDICLTQQPSSQPGNHSAGLATALSMFSSMLHDASSFITVSSLLPHPHSAPRSTSYTNTLVRVMYFLERRSLVRIFVIDIATVFVDCAPLFRRSKP